MGGRWGQLSNAALEREQGPVLHSIAPACEKAECINLWLMAFGDESGAGPKTTTATGGAGGRVESVGRAPGETYSLFANSAST